MSNTDTRTDAFPRTSKIEGSPAKVGAIPCTRCGGSGIFHTYGTCFRCGGQGIDPTERRWLFPTDWSDSQCAEWDDKRLSTNERAKNRRHEREQEQREAAVIEFYAGLDEDEAARLKAIVELPYDQQHGIANDIGWKLRHYGSISRGQIDLLFKVQAEFVADLEAAANAPVVPPLVEGRREITGIVVSTKAKDSQYGTQYKMLVEEDDGNRVFGTIPRSIDGEVWDTRREFRVSFTAEVTVSKDDENFGFFKRPTKASATPDEETK